MDSLKCHLAAVFTGIVLKLFSTSRFLIYKKPIFNLSAIEPWCPKAEILEVFNWQMKTPLFFPGLADSFLSDLMP